MYLINFIKCYWHNFKALNFQHNWEFKFQKEVHSSGGKLSSFSLGLSPGPAAILITCMLRIWDNIWIYVTTRRETQTKMAARQAKRENGSRKAGQCARGKWRGEENSNENWCGLVFKIMSCRDITCPPLRPWASFGFLCSFYFSHLIPLFILCVAFIFPHFNSFAAIFPFGECFIKFIFADKCA